MTQQFPKSNNKSDETANVDHVAILTKTLSEMVTTLSLSQVDVEDIVEKALIAAYRRYVNDDPEVHARFTKDGAYTLFRRIDGVEEVLPDANDMVIRQAARLIRISIEERKLMSESDQLSTLILERKGEMVDGILHGRDEDDTWILRTSDFPALLPSNEQIPGEALVPHQHLRVVVVSAKKIGGEIIAIVSRSHPALIRRLLEQEVPEILNGQIVVDAIAREAGHRSKVAVHAIDANVDAQGACIGTKGVRHRSLVQQLSGEHVHIVTWSQDPLVYVANALAPAAVDAVSLDPESHVATIHVPASQLSLAIGKGGENARLVAKLTSWKIDIQPTPIGFMPE